MLYFCFLFQTGYLIEPEETVQFTHTLVIKSWRHDCWSSVRVVLRLQLLGVAVGFIKGFFLELLQ